MVLYQNMWQNNPRVLLWGLFMLTYLFPPTLNGQVNVLKLDQITTKNGLPQNSVQSIVQDKYGFIWMSSFSGLHKYDGYEFTSFKPDPNNPNALYSRGIYNIVTDTAKNVYVAFYDSTFVCSYNYSQDVFERIPRYKLEDYLKKKLDRPNKKVVKNFKTEEYLWTFSDKLLTKAHKVSGKTTTYSIDVPNKSDFTNEVVSCMFIDKHQNVWLGTENQGVYKANTNVKPFYSYYNNYSGQNKLTKDIIRAIGVDKQNCVWIGTFYNGVFIYDKENNETYNLRHDPNSSNSLISNEVRSILCDSKGNVWIGTKKGLSKYNRKEDVYVNFSVSSENKIPDNWIHAILEDHTGRVWIGAKGGIAYFDEEKKQFISYKDSLLSQSYLVDAMYEDSKHNIWVGTQGSGVACLKRTSAPEQFAPIYYKHKNRANSLSSNRIFSISESPDGNIWIGTEYGLNRLSPSTGEIISLTENDGLPDEMIMGVQFDHLGKLWISHKNGLSQIDTKSFEIKNYTEEDGLQSNDFSENTCFRDINTGEIYFGGSNGLNSFYPEKITDNQIVPDVVFTELDVLNEKVVINKEVNNRVILTQSLINTKEIKIKHKDKSFSIEFAALHYANPMSNKYKYKLERYDEKWIYTTPSNRKATYTNLPAGNYTFKLIASNNEGFWTTKPAELSVTVLPPWWNNKVVYVVYAFILIGLFYLIYTYTVNKEKLKTKIKFEQMKAQKVMELDEMKIQFFTNVSHEFRTPLSLIIDPLRKLNTTEIPQEEAKYYYSVMYKNAQALLNMVNQLLDFRKIEKGYMKLDIRQMNIVPLVKNVFDSFELNAKQQNVSYQFTTASNNIIARFDIDKLEKIIKNLLSNAFKYTSDGGEIHVWIANEKLSTPVEDGSADYVVVSISDSGVGISQKHQKKIFDRFYQVKETGALQSQGTGIGLAYTKQLVDLLKGQITLESAPNQGSVFKVKLPAGNIQSALSSLSEGDTQSSSHAESNTDDELDTGLEEGGAIDENEKLLLLLVEDDIEIRSYLKHELSSRYRIVEAVNGEEGVALVLSQTPDIVVTDIVMPKVDGLELCKTIKSDERTSHIPVVMLTAKQSDSIKKNGYEFGADAYVTKPFNTSVLMALLNNLVDSRKKLKNAYSKQLFIDVKKISNNSTDEEFMTQFIYIVEENICNADFSIDNLSEIMKMNRRHLTHKIKTLTGSTVLDFIKTIRMNKGANLLLTGEYTVAEVSYMLGYNVPANFSRSFTKHFGQSPSGFISSQQ